MTSRFSGARHAGLGHHGGVLNRGLSVVVTVEHRETVCRRVGSGYHFGHHPPDRSSAVRPVARSASVVCDGQDEDLVVGSCVANVVGVATNSNLAEDLTIDLSDWSAHTGPVHDRLDRVIDSGKQGKPETSPAVLIPPGRFPKLGLRLRLEADPTTQPANSSAIR